MYNGNHEKMADSGRIDIISKATNNVSIHWTGIRRIFLPNGQSQSQRYRRLKAHQNYLPR